MDHNYAKAAWLRGRLPGAAAVCALLTLALFAGQTVMMHSTLAFAGGLGGAALLSALYTAVFAFAAFAYLQIEKPDSGMMLFTGLAMAVLMLARTAMLDYQTADYTSFLAGWTQIFREGGFKMLAEDVGDYNLLYQYLLLIISKTPIKDLYLIKLFSVAFDYLLALAMMCAAGRFASSGMRTPVLLMTLAIPTVLIDGACWGQCDAVYVFFIIFCLYMMETDRPYRAAISLAVAFAFKLQTIFFFPVVLLGLIHKKFKLRHALAFFAAYVVTMLPAMVAGRTFMEAVSVYASQSMGQYYDRLTYNAPNLYLFFPMMAFDATQEYTWMRYITDIDGKATNPYLQDALMPQLQHAALYACIILTLIVVVYWLLHWREVTPDLTLDVALFFAIFLPFVMPKIHERYFFLADMLAVLYAARYANRRFVPVLVITASLMCYMPYITRQRPIDERWLALMMLAALVVVSRDVLHKMRRNRAMLKGGAPL